VPVAKGDKRFASPDWKNSSAVRFPASGAYDRRGLGRGSGRYARTISIPPPRPRRNSISGRSPAPLSPANFVVPIRRLLRETLSSSGEQSRVVGRRFSPKDIEAGHGQLRIRQTTARKFELGVNGSATTPGKVVFRNEIFELIQYTPTTGTVLKRPLLIVARPGINNSIFSISILEKASCAGRWTRGSRSSSCPGSIPTSAIARTTSDTFEDYITEGPFKALDAVEAATGERPSRHRLLASAAPMLAYGPGLYGGNRRRADRQRDVLRGSDGFHRSRRDQGFHRRPSGQVAGSDHEVPANLDGSKNGGGVFNICCAPTISSGPMSSTNVHEGQAPRAGLRRPLREFRFQPACPPSIIPSYSPQFLLENKLAKGETGDWRKKLSLAKVTTPSTASPRGKIISRRAASVFRGAKLFGGPIRYVPRRLRS